MSDDGFSDAEVDEEFYDASDESSLEEPVRNLLEDLELSVKLKLDLVEVQSVEEVCLAV